MAMGGDIEEEVILKRKPERRHAREEHFIKKGIYM
jgi:hypothetical protein